MVFNLIEEFKKEHLVIINTLNRVKKLGIGSKKGHDAILSAQKNILTHIKEEDEKLYPVLRKSVENNRKLKETLDVFVGNMGAISDSIFHFFGNYSMKAGNQLTMEIEWLIETLSWRILREEIFIFTMYENLH